MSEIETKAKKRHDPSGFFRCTHADGKPFKRVSAMTLEELQQIVCHEIATDFARQNRQQIIDQMKIWE
jgi:hypothetical protein